MKKQFDIETLKANSMLIELSDNELGNTLGGNECPHPDWPYCGGGIEER